MQVYIDQLLEDMAAAQRPEQERSLVEQPFSIEQHLEEVERWIAGEDPEHAFAYYCGLQPEQFPPAEDLTDEQLLAISQSFKKLLFSWNLDVSLPESLPLPIAYPFLISTLKEKVQIVTDGFIGIEFCTYDPPSCPFKEYCSCTEYLTEDNEEIGNRKEEDNDALPY